MHPKLVKCGLILAAAFGLTACAPAACTGPKLLEAQVRAHSGAESFTKLGTWFREQGQYGCAVETFRTALKFEPDSPRILYFIGLSFYTAGDLKESVAALEQSIQHYSGEIKAHLILAAALSQLRQNAAAEAEWKAALQLDPGSKVALDGLSKNLIANGDYASTIALLQAAPLDENLALDLALAYADSGMLDHAADTLTKALQANPSSSRLTSALTTIYVTQTRYQEAARVAEKAARLYPRDLDAQRLYLRVLVLNSEFDHARPLGQKLLAAFPHDFDFLYLNGILEHQAREDTAARDHLQEAIALNPNHYNARYNLALVLDQLKDLHGAKEQLEKALTLGATEPEVRFELSKVLRGLGETQAAQDQLKLYQEELKQKANRTLAAGKAAQAAQEYAAGDPQKAVELYREALDAMPQNALLSYKLALALDRSGDTTAEIAALQQAIRIDPGLALAQNQLGYLESRSGDSASAEEHFRLAVRAAPGYTQAWLSLAAILGMQSRFAEAQEAVASALRVDPNNAEALQLRKALSDAQAQR
jgi:tetratricopeptide (TPR) repeat protein